MKNLQQRKQLLLNLMRKRDKELFLKELRKNPNISIVCRILNISRDTVYRWKKEDCDFETEFDYAVNEGRLAYYDLAESKLIGAVNEGKRWAVLDCLNRFDPQRKEREEKDRGEKITGNMVIFRDFSDPSKEKEIEGLD